MAQTTTPRTLLNLKTRVTKTFPSGSAAKKIMRQEPGEWSRVLYEQPSRTSFWGRAWTWFRHN